MLSLDLAILFCLIMLLAGSIKGLVGLGLPTISISLMLFFFEPQQALGLIVIPLVLTNLLQALQSGQVGWVLKNFWPFLLTIAITIYIASGFAARINERYFYLLIAIGILLFLISQRKFFKCSQLENHPVIAMWAGSMAGVLGGFTTVWGPPTVIYLRLINLDKEQFVRAAGWMFLIGGIPLLIGYWNNGLLTQQIIPSAIIGTLFAVVGLQLGSRYRSKISEQRFVLIIDWVLALMAINLLRKALGY